MRLFLLVLGAIILLASVLCGDSEGQWSTSDKKSDRHYDNSKKACDEAMKIVVRRGDIMRLTVNEKKEVIGLLKLAISEAMSVEDSYLAKVHPLLPDKYDKEYIRGMSMLAEGLEKDSSPLTLGGTYGYNEFATWSLANKDKMKFPK
jgi:hypothetical protein